MGEEVMISLSMITNDADRTIKILEKYGQHFDKWFITVADKDKSEYKKLEGYNDKLNLSYFKWVDHFGKAREFNRKQIDTEFMFWCDSDDEVEGLENIPELIQHMEENSLDAIYAMYKYMTNDLGEEIAPHWRERIVRTKSYKWANNRCHETLLADNARYDYTNKLTIIHNKTREEEQASMERNIRLLELDYADTNDPRTAMYLGDNYLHKQDYANAMKYSLLHLQHSGSDEDKYRSWLRISDIFFLQENYGEALNAINAAQDVLPAYPDAYFAKATIYNAMNQPEKVYEWVKVGLLKPRPVTMKVTDPTLYEYRGLFMGALAALELGKIDEAIKMFTVVRQKSPDYAPAKNIEHIFEEAYYDKEAVEKLKWLLYYLKENGGDPSKLFTILPPRLFADPRLNVERNKFIKPKEWPEKSIVFFCGQTTEFWGPEEKYMEKGMGGSEEAIVYLTAELVKLGWNITVYNDREEEIYKDGVTWKPWTTLNQNDTYDVFVSWRNPHILKGIKARIKAVDLHDTPVGHVEITDDDISSIDLFFFKTNYQTTYSPSVPKEKIVIIPNGIKKEHFNEKQY